MMRLPGLSRSIAISPTVTQLACARSSPDADEPTAGPGLSAHGAGRGPHAGRRDGHDRLFVPGGYPAATPAAQVPERQRRMRSGAGVRAKLVTYAAGADGAFSTVRGRGHRWPGSTMPPAITTHDIDATDALLACFADPPQPRARAGSRRPGLLSSY